MRVNPKEVCFRALYKLPILLSLFLLLFSVVLKPVSANFSNQIDYGCPYCLDTLASYNVSCDWCSPPKPDLRVDYYLCFDCDGSSRYSGVTYCTNYSLCP